MNDKISLVNIPETKLQELQLIRDVSKHLKKGHRWIFDDCFDMSQKVKSEIGIIKNKNEIIAVGLIQADTKLKARVLFLSDDFYFKPNNLNNSISKWAGAQFKKAVQIRKYFHNNQTNSFRLINGEGDGMPGLIIDIYDYVAVIKHDHEVAMKFWNHTALAKNIIEEFPFIKCVYHKKRNDEEIKGENIIGELPLEVIFKENGSLFATNIRDAAKTGFFLDQRDNRKLVGQFAHEKSVLNLFSYTAGFSVFAAKGNAKSVTSVDIAKKAIEAAERNFEVNELKTHHSAIHQDAFLFIDEAIGQKEKWDMVITDPPSFAPNQKAIETANAAYEKVFSQSLKLVNQNGYFVASSCSSHITELMFLDILKEVFSKNRKRATLVYLGGQPFDHPYPLNMEELRYLKFALFRVD